MINTNELHVPAFRVASMTLDWSFPNRGRQESKQNVMDRRQVPKHLARFDLCSRASSLGSNETDRNSQAIMAPARPASNTSLASL